MVLEKKTVISYRVIIKSILMGFVFGEMGTFILFIIGIFGKSELDKRVKVYLCISLVLYTIYAGFLAYRQRKILQKYIKSKRFDLLINFVLGLSIASLFFYESIACFKEKFFDFGVGLINIIDSISSIQLTGVMLIPFIAVMSKIIRENQLDRCQKNNCKSEFLVDKEIQNQSDDKLNFAGKAELFAEMVFDNNSSESIVFGLDAPWGVGKSSFINLCKEDWRKKYDGKIIVYDFNPLKYENEENLLDKFKDGFVKEIKKNVFVPEIDSAMSKYMNVIKGLKASFVLAGFRLWAPEKKENIDDAFKRLEMVIQNLDQKILVIVDDLDRLDFIAIKKVLNVVKKSFLLPNVSYVLCYDTENINAIEEENPNTEKISEFLEKFVNVKTSIYIDVNLLMKTIIQIEEENISKRNLTDNQLVLRTLKGIEDIFKSIDFYMYRKYICDIRKLKRLINTILLLNIEDTDFEHLDFDKEDLIHLLLIYINHPNIFRDIYNSETNGQKGIFSVVTKGEVGYQDESNGNEETLGYQNTEDYREYLQKCTESQKFLLEKVFNLRNKTKDKNVNAITIEMHRSYACFNGYKHKKSYRDSLIRSGLKERNLERTLYFIVDGLRPVKTEQYRYYIRKKDEILKGKNISEVFKELEFSCGEKAHAEMWKIIKKTDSNEFSVAKAEEVIEYALNSISEYSLFRQTYGYEGIRNTLILYIVVLLDKIGWSDKSGGRTNNYDKEISGIAKWIYGEEKHKGKGVLEILGKEEKGILGIYDLLTFRLYCCVDRGGYIYNLRTALSLHSNEDPIREGDVREIVKDEIRELTQMIFQIFKEQYIDTKISIFEEINKLELKDACGKSIEYLKKEIENIDMEVKKLKNSIKIFMTYQLSNYQIDSGIGCGYYDTSGDEDKRGIHEEMNKYLFETCFNIGLNQNAYIEFINFILINSSNRGRGHKISEVSKILSLKILKEYWGENRQNIKKVNFENKIELITDDYKRELKNIFRELDNLIEFEVDSE